MPQSEPSTSAQRPKTSYVPRPVQVHKETPEISKPLKARPQTSHCSKFVRSEADALGIVPEYVKSFKSRVSFEKYSEHCGDRRSTLKNELPKPRPRRPQTPGFITNLEKIPEEPEPIGDGENLFRKISSEILMLKELIEGLKVNCDDSHKKLQERVDFLESKIKKEYQKEFELHTNDKSREIANLMKKNEALNTSLKHKADENLKLKRELSELKALQRSSISETASTRT